MNKFTKAFKILIEEEKKKSIKILVLIFIGMLLEMMGIGLIIPLINLVGNIENIKKIPFGTTFFEYLSDLDSTKLTIYAFSFFLFISFFKMLILIFIIKKQTKFTYGLLSTISSRLFRYYLNKDYNFHLKNNSSYLIKNTITETQIFITHIVSPFITIITEVVVLLGLLIVLLYIDFEGTALISILMLVFGILFFYLIKVKLNKSGAQRIYYEGERLKYLTEAYNSVKEIKISGKENFYQNKYFESVTMSTNATSQQVYINQLPRLFIEFLGVLTICIYIFIQLNKGVDFERLVSVLIVYALAAFRLMPSVNRIVGSLSAIQFSKNVIDHIFMDDEDLRNSQVNQEYYLGSFDNLNIKNLNYSHLDGTKALNDINFTINKSDKLAIVGSSGSGKTTLINVVMGLLDCNNDSILINGIDIRKCCKTWQKKIGYVGQNINLIDTSIAKNIAFGVPDDEINYSLINDLVMQLNLDSFINNLENGVNTIVGENGSLLSGGQKQRICIARALYKNPEVLILDEATSALDEATERNIMKALSSNFKNLTIIFITHRISTLKYCDYVIRLDKGYIEDFHNTQKTGV